MIRPQWLGKKSIYPDWLRRTVTIIDVITSLIPDYIKSWFTIKEQKSITLALEYKHGKI